MATSTYLFVAFLIAISSFVPHRMVLGVQQTEIESQDFHKHSNTKLSPFEVSDPFQEQLHLKQQLSRLGDKSLTASQHTEVAREIIEEVQALSDSVLQFQTYLALLESIAIRIDLDESQNVLQLAKDIDQKVEAPELTARLQCCQARYCNKTGEYENAIELIKKAQASQLLSQRHLVTSNLILGVSCGRLGWFEQSFVAFQKILAIADLSESVKQENDFKIALGNLAALFLKMKKYDKAAAVYNQLDPLDPTTLIFLRVTIGRCTIASSRSNFKAAIELSQTAIDACELQRGKSTNWVDQKKRGYTGVLYLAQAQCYYELRDLPKAQKLCTRAIELIDSNSPRFYDAMALQGIVIALLGEADQGIEIVRQAYQAAADSGQVYSTLVASQQLTQIYEDSGRHKEAFAQFKVTEEIENSMKLNDLELQLELSEMQYRAELESQRIMTEERAKSKQAELVAANAISQAEKSKAIQYGVGMALALTLVGGGGYLVSQSRRRKIQYQLVETRELAELQEQIAQKKRIEDIGKLTGSVAHEFNNILQIICQTNFLIEDSLGEHLTDIQQQLFDNEGEAVAVASKITEQLLTYAKRQATAPKVASVAAMLGSTLAMYGSVGGATQVDVLEFDDTLTINVDPTHFSSSIFNLLINARDSMEGTGLIEIRVTEETISEATSLNLQRGDYVCIEVSDAGRGMTDEQLQRACEPFFTTKQLKAGTGLGLSSVKGFVEQAGGTIEIESTLGRNASVSLYFPKAGIAVGSSPTSEFNFIAPNTKFERVCLIVEDNPLVRSTLELMMESCGYKSTSCCSADEARDLLKIENGFSLVLSDIRMPGEWDGIDLAQWIKVTHPEIQVILISGNDAPSNLKGVIFLRKPFRFPGLQSVLEAESVRR